MSAQEKIGKKVTVKDLNIELKLLMEKIKNLEQKEVEKDVKIKDMEITIRGNKDKLAKLEKMLTEIDPKKISKEIGVMCKECGESFPSKRDLTDHIKNIHPKKYSCKMCVQSFSESWSLELHSKSHEEIVPFKCGICDQEFYVKWRLKKHVLSHEKKGKFCHFFNNGKICPFQEIGCKFKHEVSNNCRYDEKCHIKLCQFKHSTNFKEVNDKETDWYSKYNNMDENQQWDVGEEICMNICWGGSHKCMNHDDDNELLGVDVVKIRDDYENCRRDKFHCEKCEYSSTKMEEVKNHFIINHEKEYSCWECEGNFSTITEFKKHYGSFHYTEEEITVDST